MKKRRKWTWFSSPLERAAFITGAWKAIVALIAATATVFALIWQASRPVSCAPVGSYPSPDTWLWYPWFSNQGIADMRVPDGFLKTVVFIGIRQGQKFIPKATGFLVLARDQDIHFFYAVTAEHVIAKLNHAYGQIYIRVNKIGGGAFDYELPYDLWRFYPDERNPSDVAVCIFQGDMPREQLDIKAIMVRGKDEFIATKEIISNSNIGPGDEVAIVGLFRSHYGVDHNRPVVRIGNIASLQDEPVKTGYCGYTDAYLVEAMSIGGLSGSPVFLMRPPVGVIPNNADPTKFNPQRILFLGLMHGHYDVTNLNEDVVTDGTASDRGIHTGLGIVIPVEKILATIDHPDLVEARAAMIKKLREDSGAKPDVLADDDLDAAPKDTNPTHREDFMRLANAAARTRKPDE